MDLIAEGIKQKLIRIEDDGKYISYIHQDKRRNYTNPEERVQAEAFLQLVLTYQYPRCPCIYVFTLVGFGHEDYSQMPGRAR